MIVHSKIEDLGLALPAKNRGEVNARYTGDLGLASQQLVARLFVAEIVGAFGKQFLIVPLIRRLLGGTEQQQKLDVVIGRQLDDAREPAES